MGRKLQQSDFTFREQRPWILPSTLSNAPTVQPWGDTFRGEGHTDLAHPTVYNKSCGKMYSLQEVQDQGRKESNCAPPKSQINRVPAVQSHRCGFCCAALCKGNGAVNKSYIALQLTCLWAFSLCVTKKMSINHLEMAHRWLIYLQKKFLLCPLQLLL